MPIREQSSLGESVRETKKDQDMNGVLFFGKVVKVYQKNHSADVEILNNQYGKLLSSDSNQGKYACKILESYAGFDSEANVSFGVITPIQVGCSVLVGFINNCKSQPVILGCFHNTDGNKNVLPSDYPLKEGEEIYRKTVVSRLRDYFTVNSDGEYEFVHHSGAYLTMRNETIDDEKFDWEDLQLTKNGKFPQSKSAKPLSILARIQTFVGNIKLFINGATGLMRLLNTGTDQLAMIELDDDKNFRIRLQRDSDEVDKGKEYSQISMDMKTGDIEISQIIDGKQNQFSMSKSSGITMSSNIDITITNTKSIKMNSNTSVSINSPDINISL